MFFLHLHLKPDATIHPTYPTPLVNVILLQSMRDTPPPPRTRGGQRNVTVSGRHPSVTSPLPPKQDQLIGHLTLRAAAAGRGGEGLRGRGGSRMPSEGGVPAGCRAGHAPRVHFHIHIHVHVHVHCGGGRPKPKHAEGPGATSPDQSLPPVRPYPNNSRTKGYGRVTLDEAHR